MTLASNFFRSYPDIGLEWSAIQISMLKLTKKADYGLIALRHLALGATGATASAKEIADAYRLPLPLLSKILQKLAKDGMLQSVAGTNGGYRLTRAPEKISAMEVIRAIDGPIVLTSCFSEPGDHGGCNTSSLCTVREPLRRVHEAMLGLLDKFTIAELAAEAKTDRVDNLHHPKQQTIQIAGMLPAAVQAVKTELTHDEAYLPR